MITFSFDLFYAVSTVFGICGACFQSLFKSAVSHFESMIDWFHIQSLCNAPLKTLASHSNSLCLCSALLCFCSTCILELTFIVACTDFPLSRLSPPRTHAASGYLWNICSQIAPLLLDSFVQQPCQNSPSRMPGVLFSIEMTGLGTDRDRDIYKYETIGEYDWVLLNHSSTIN